MEYKKILGEQARKLNIAYKYWPLYLYHFSDIHNIVHILYEGIILSRNEAKSRGLMLSDNSSERVIEKTKEDAFNYARLYFRPQTPTQYHSEGYKPESIRDHEINASCPVPVFLILDADTILSMEGTCFVEQGIAGVGHKVLQGIEEFKQLSFERIYDNRLYSGEKWQIEKKYRMSEIINQSGFPLEKSLKGIVCRSEAEKETLCCLLKEKSDSLYEKYINYINFKPDFECFFYNGLFVNNVDIRGNTLDIDFDTPAERRYHVAQIDVKIQLTMWDSYGTVIENVEYKKIADYDNAAGFQIPIEIPLSADRISIRLLFDGIEMYKNNVYIGEEIMI